MTCLSGGIVRSLGWLTVDNPEPLRQQPERRHPAQRGDFLPDFLRDRCRPTQLNLSNNPNLAPAPPLGLTADVTKEDDGQTAVALSWDHTGGTPRSRTLMTRYYPSDVTHSYQYCEMATCGADDWQDATSHLHVTDGTAIVPKGKLPSQDTCK